MTGGVLAIDAGNSKTDVLLVAPDGSVVGRARGGGFRPHDVGARAAVDALQPLVEEVVTGGVPVAHVSACLANADLAIEHERLQSEIERHGWGDTTYVGNDTLALLRAGVERPPGVAVVCGAGINCSGVGPDGRTAGFAAIGRISGDWGGGTDLVEEAMWWAARAADGRGPDTALVRLLPEHFGRTGMAELIEAVHLGEIPEGLLYDATPVLFEAARAGDEVAVSVVLRQAEEVVALAVSVLRRLELLDEQVDVVLGGGVLTGGHALLLDAIGSGLAAAAPLAVPVVVAAPPVLGAALLGLDRIGAAPAAHQRLREAFA
ncbi:N-acetylglucosamine kinase [Nocardioides sp. T2.26MG-1]|uniref:N-acetylglucosamine kinase n=1 Tax=Nocardioides sp. T2.26MG-1 TaxID=3041166 RepID=UPI002477A8D2|nr:BadF/BadG/BcrA/BcrD ATPase family protein [Nocardioides sp. T2.26MG-1]CAI9416174.1 N-acetylmuramic acid/N-acetylglucosamine kinase [Nocardioides sp. T2.26MG-1]